MCSSTLILADRIRLDVFALGALAYYVLAGRPAATDRASLQDRLRRDNGLDLAADLPQVAPDVRDLVLEATRPKVSERLPDVRAFLSKLANAEKALAAADEEVTDPLEAAPGFKPAQSLLRELSAKQSNDKPSAPKPAPNVKQ